MQNSDRALPELLTVAQASAILIGIVVGIGIFKTPPLVAAYAGSEGAFIWLWLLGGALTIAGALCYAELGSSHPSPGGEVHYLSRAYGDAVGFLFAWGRMTVMQSGAIAAVAFAYGDYAQTIVPLGTYGAAVHGAGAVIALSLLQITGTGVSGRLQVMLTLGTIALILALSLSSLFAPGAPLPVEAAAANAAGNGGSGGGLAGLALVFILLTYGGWNEAAYLSGEIRDVRRNMVRVLLLGTGAVIVLYVVFNLSLVAHFGIEQLAQEKVVTGPVDAVFGTWGAAIAAGAICIAALSTLNGTLFTGARSIYALGRQFAPFAALGRTNASVRTPALAIAAQAGISLALVAFGAIQRDGFAAMVEYTAPVFWLFMLLTGTSLFVFRWREPDLRRPFRVPLYPLTPLLFCATALYLLHASIAYTGTGGLIGLAILLAGLPVYLLNTRRSRTVRA
ncbi:MAG: amino acid permease [Hyphomicrobium sp.]|nr:amino acid permease [Hyphomicrobium sp.]